MLATVLFLVGIAVILLIARYNKSNKLFWTLLLAMLAGFAGGTIATKVMKNDNGSHASLYQSMPTQGFNFSIDAVLPQYLEEQNILACAEPVSQTFSESTTSYAIVLSQRNSFIPNWLVGANPGIAMNFFDTS